MTGGGVAWALTVIAGLLFAAAALAGERTRVAPYRVRLVAGGMLLLCLAALIPDGAAVY